MSLWHTCLYCKEYYDFNKGHFCKYKIGDKLTCFKEGLSKFEVCKKCEHIADLGKMILGEGKC